MNIIKRFRINRALKKELGPGIVKVISGWDDYPYALRFKDDDPAQEIMDKATDIVDGFVPTFWHYEAMRRTEK